MAELKGIRVKFVTAADRSGVIYGGEKPEGIDGNERGIGVALRFKVPISQARGGGNKPITTRQ